MYRWGMQSDLFPRNFLRGILIEFSSAFLEDWNPIVDGSLSKLFSLRTLLKKAGP